uniref:Uncharacterized protein n=1 Tax=viral metagenome TaxID=1070528 RepID=A0A6M3L0D2_9ZZZZ
MTTAKIINLAAYRKTAQMDKIDTEIYSWWKSSFPLPALTIETMQKAFDACKRRTEFPPMYLTYGLIVSKGEKS